MEYSTPVKFSGISAYEFPFRMEQVRGTLVWNAINPRTPIGNIEYVNLLKLTATKVETFDQIVMSSDLSEEDLGILRAVRRFVFGNEDLAPYGFGRICIPKTVTVAPSWVIPFIDVEEMVTAAVRPGLILLDSLGVECVEARGDTRLSNIVKF